MLASHASNERVPCARSVTIKLGPRYDMGDLCPKEAEGWTFAIGGTDFGIWEKAA